MYVVGHLKIIMKYKNYKSAIHNFTHSFISIDYMKSGRLAINVLVELYNIRLESKATFDFINKTIQPSTADSKESRQLMVDYLTWLPDHFKKYNCDLTNLEKLEIIIWTDFKNTTPSERNPNDRIFTVSAITNWKANGRDNETVEISQTQIIPKRLLSLDKIPRMTEF